MSDYSELKDLAEKASPGPWWIDSHGMTMMSMPKLEVVFNHPAQSIAVRNEETGNLSRWRNDWDASYIAAANPKTVLALISEVESLQLELKDFQWGASVEAQAGDEARSEASALRKDAARYRWLREQEAEHGVCIINVGEWTAGATCIATTFHSAEFADEMVDAAMSKEG